VQFGNYLLILPKNQGRYPTEKWIRIPADFNQGTYADAHHRALHVVSSGWLTAVALERQGAVVKVQVTNAVNNPSKIITGDEYHNVSFTGWSDRRHGI
jgi:hypothetical protein